jgi:hypothetical protein
MAIAAKDLEIDMMFVFEGRSYRVIDILKDDVQIQIDARRQTVLGEALSDFCVLPHTEFDEPPEDD